MNHLNLAHLISVFFCRKDFYPCQPDSEQTLKFQRKVKKKTKNKKQSPLFSRVLKQKFKK